MLLVDKLLRKRNEILVHGGVTIKNFLCFKDRVLLIVLYSARSEINLVRRLCPLVELPP